MGLDMYLYAIKKGYPGCYTEDTTQRIEIAYWRKHSSLHGLMERIWKDKGAPLPEGRNPVNDDFNCVPVLLDTDDIDYVISQVKANKLPETSGFFFGNYLPDARSKKEDIKIFREAQVLAKLGYEVFYDSWW